MWQFYLDMKEYATALAYCRNPIQRDQVYLVQVIAYPDGLLQLCNVVRSSCSFLDTERLHICLFHSMLY